MEALMSRVSVAGMDEPASSASSDSPKGLSSTSFVGSIANASGHYSRVYDGGLGTGRVEVGKLLNGAHVTEQV